MDDRVRVLRSRSEHGPTVLALRSAIAGCLALLSFATLLFVAGCASPEDLALTLQTTEDPLERQKAAVDLAGEHSPALTQRLVSAAENDATAAKGLAALRDEYVLYINSAIEKARIADKAFTSETELALRDAVDCLALMEDVPSVEALGALLV